MTWFMLKDEEICGPYEAADIFEKCDSTTLIWGPGMGEWSDKESWQSFLNRPKPTAVHSEVDITEDTHEPFNEVDMEKSSVEEVAEHALHLLNDKWFYAYEGKKFGPLNQSHLILKLSNLENVENALLWKKGQDKWKPLFEFPKILNVLNEKLDEKKAA